MRDNLIKAAAKVVDHRKKKRRRPLRGLRPLVFHPLHCIAATPTTTIPCVLSVSRYTLAQTETLLSVPVNYYSL